MVSKALRVMLSVLMLAGMFISLSQEKANAGIIGPTSATIVYEQPPDPIGVLLHSSWWDPNGSTSDRYVWDDFTLPTSKNIVEIDWIGGYDPAYSGSGGPVLDFTVAIYPTIAAGTQPDIFNPLAQYQLLGNAGESPAGTYGEIAMYKYSFKLPTTFIATSGTKYWIEIYAWQHGTPDWGLAKGTGGDGIYFLRIHGAGDTYHLVAGDAAFTLLAPGNQIYLPLILQLAPGG